MELFLWRHADALPGISSDFDRELSPRGHQQAGKAAEWLREHVRPAGISDMRILVSPAIRTRQTVAHFCKEEDKIQLCRPLYDNASPKEILDILGWPDTILPTLIVGHQPQIGMLADRLLARIPHPEGNLDPWSRRKVPESFRKGALWWLRIESGQNKTQLVDLIEP